MSKFSVAILRVSGDKQTDESQKQPIFDEIAKRGLHAVDIDDFKRHREAYARQDAMCVVCHDVGSGRNVKRAGYQFAHGAVNQGLVNAVLMWRGDRLARNAKTALEFAELCRQREVELFSCTEHVDLTTPAGKMQYGMLALMAECQSDVIGQNTKAGLRAAKAKAEKEGRPWKCGGKNKGVLSNRVKKLIPQFLEMLELGHTIRHTSKVLGLTTRTVVRLRARRKELEETFGHKKYKRMNVPVITS